MKTKLSIRSAFKTITTPGTAEALVAPGAAVRIIHRGVVAIVARRDKTTPNIGNIYVGNRYGQNLTLGPGGHVVLRATGERELDLAEVFIDAVSSGDGVLWAWVECEADLATALAGVASAGTTDALIGALAETAPASDTASSGLNGRLQRIAQRLTSILTSTDKTVPATTAAAVTPDDSTPLTSRAVWVGGVGDLVVRLAGATGTDVTFTAVPAGTLLPISVVRVMAATTASNINVLN